MPINVSGNFSAASSSLSSQSRIETGFERVSSGKRINSALDDAAGLAIATKFSKEIGGLAVAARNAGDGISLTQVADGALSSLTSNLTRIRELAVSAANGTLNDQDREGLAAEARQLQDQNQGLLDNTSFNGVPLLNQDTQSSLQIGPDAGDVLSFGGSNLAETLSNLGLSDIDLGTQSGASDALSVLDEALGEVVSVAGDFGAVANRLESTIDNLNSARINETEARSRVEDADLAKELSEISAGLVQEQVGIAVQSQANAQRGFVLQLLQG